MEKINSKVFNENFDGEVELASSISQLTQKLRIFPEDDNLLFRGQNKDFELVPMIGRDDILKKIGHMSQIENIEKDMFRDFKRMSPGLTGEAGQTFDDWDYMTLARHYGLPTRLLDWTPSLFVALWFSLKNAQNAYSVIWVLVPPDAHIISGSNPFEIKTTKVFYPRHIDKRISSQNGVFTAHPFKIKNSQGYARLNRHNEFKGNLLKIVILKENQEKMRGELVQGGVDEFSIFRDLDGLCKKISSQYLKNI